MHSSEQRYPVRAFTAAGLALFRKWLDDAEMAEPKRYSASPPPEHLLFEDTYSKPIRYGNPLARRTYARKFDLGMAVCSAFGQEDTRRLLNEPNAWPWLSLFFCQSTFPQKKGKWFTGERSRHLVQTIEGRKQDQSHRHLVKGAVTNVIRFGVHAVVLMGDAHGQSKMEEQVMSRRSDQPLAFHKEFVKALYELYWDIDADTLKSGARGEGPGSVMHMIDLLTQFDLTFDIASLDAPLLLQLLPKDFKRFTSPATRQSARPSRNAQKVDESAISPQ